MVVRLCVSLCRAVCSVRAGGFCCTDELVYGRKRGKVKCGEMKEQGIKITVTLPFKEAPDMKVQAFALSPALSNCYVVSTTDEPGAQAVLIDPGDTELEPVFDYIEAHKFQVKAIWLTHAHVDHALGVDIARDKYGVPVLVHPHDYEDWWAQTHVWGKQMMGRDAEALRHPDGFIHDGDVLTLGENRFTVWHTPGHSRGCVLFVGSEIAFTGDTVFKGTIGRLDLPHGDEEAMQQSLKRVLGLQDELTLYPGHMGSTTMAAERKTNPFLRNL